MPIPIHRIPFGKLEATVWCTVQSGGVREYTATIERLVESDSGAWKRTQSLSRIELRLLPGLADKAYEFIRQAQRIDRENAR